MKFYDGNEIFNNISQRILLIGRNFNVVDANQAFCDHIQLPLNKIIGKSCYNLSHGYEKPCSHYSDILCPAKIAFETQKRTRSTHSRTKDGERMLEEVVVTPLKGNDYVIQEIMDISKFPGIVNGILSICSVCKSICDSDGKWYHLEGYVHGHTGADISHGICPECYQIECRDFLE